MPTNEEMMDSLTLAREYAGRARSYTERPMPVDKKATADAIASLAFIGAAILEAVLAADERHTREIRRLHRRLDAFENGTVFVDEDDEPVLGDFLEPGELDDMLGGES